MKRYKVRADDYGLARLVQCYANFLGGTLSIGVGSIDTLDCDNGDNGLYIIRDWVIIERQLIEPENEHIDPEYEEEVFRAMCSVNDKVFGYDCENRLTQGV
ncbi:hypothetical protein [Polynucleobacter sp. es-MAR-4]|uniref:hypothetical protein n=1 Tax=Polynucleobacter sp. es-MAR-4 TaxID=1855655 RepID=UPI001C0D6217|nr:hypothetical protein [Polynucleobacter sp. es-MAR-4]MBU3637354.1 hypothetical protein [Polynucleobacter sp. es-MAR-4]